MSSTFLGCRTGSVVVLSSACDASVFDAAPVQHDAAANAVSADAGDGDAGARSQQHDAGKGGAVATQTSMSNSNPAPRAAGAASRGMGGSSGAAGKPGSGNAAGSGGKSASAGAGGNPASVKCNTSCNAEHARGMCEQGKCAFIACASPEIQDGKVRFGALGELETTSATLQDAASPTRDETDVCGDDEAFLGFNIGFGSNIDRLTSLCSSWSVRD